MKKKLYTTIIIALLAVCCTALFACNDASPDTAIYTCASNGINYSVTIDYEYHTFVMNVRDNIEYSYSGSYTTNNGYLKLTSERNGDEYILIVGETFSFVDVFNNDPDSPSSVCAHVYKEYKVFTGDCATYSYVEYKCDKCNDTYKTYGEYGDHSYTVKQKVESTCLAYGYTINVCSICKKEIRNNETTLGDHVPSGNEVVYDNGCCALTTVKESCDICQNVFTKTLDYYGSHDYDDKGKCTVCHYLDNGYSANHPDDNSDGKCDNCGYSKTLLADMENKGYHILGNVIYFGYYPSSLATHTAETIKKEGIFDKDTGYYRYKGESYAILNNEKVLSGTFSSGKEVKKNTEYAFILEPIKWYIKSIDGTQYSLYCSTVLDYSNFLQSTNQKVTDGIYYNTYTKVEGVKANDFVYSELYSFINNSFKNHLLTNYQKSLVEGNFSIISTEDVSAFNIEPPTVSDYALIKGVAAISEYNITGKYNNVGNIFTKNADSDNSNCVMALLTDKTIKSKSVTLNYGFLPTITVNLE